MSTHITGIIFSLGIAIMKDVNTNIINFSKVKIRLNGWFPRPFSNVNALDTLIDLLTARMFLNAKV